MKNHSEILKKLQALPPKVSTPLAQLLDSELIDAEVLTAVLEAGELAKDNARLLGFAIAFLTHRASHVPVHDVIRMAKTQKRQINLNWSAKRWRAEHDRLSRGEALDKLSADNTAYELSDYKCHLPSRFEGYLITSSRRLGMEGFRQRHCIASYHSRLKNGNCAIASLFVDRERWTVELVKNDNVDMPPSIVQIKGRHNKIPSDSIRKRIYEQLALELPKASRHDPAHDQPPHAYMENLQRLLPVLRANDVERVEVEFDGGGDSGAIESVFFVPQRAFNIPHVRLDFIEQTRYFEDGRWIVARQVVQGELNDVIEQVTDDYLEETNVDWYNDDGGFGQLVIDVQNGTVCLEVNVRYSDSTTEFVAETDIETGEPI